MHFGDIRSFDSNYVVLVLKKIVLGFSFIIIRCFIQCMYEDLQNKSEDYNVSKESHTVDNSHHIISNIELQKLLQ